MTDMMSKISLFSELEPEDLAIITSHGIERNYAKGTVVINEGDESDSFYIINSGKVKVFASDEDGKEVILSSQGPGEYFGELALIDSAPRSASVVTVEKSCLTVVSKKNFENCVAENSQLVLKMMCPLVKRIRFLTKNVKNLALLDVYGRVARTLLELATEKDDVLAIEERITHQELANMVGASREMVSRIMKDLAAGHYIEVENKRITIPKKQLPEAY